MLFSFSFLLAPLLLGAASRVQAVPPANLSSSALLFSDALQQSPLSFPPPSSHLRNLPDLNDASIEELQDGLRSSLFTSEELILAYRKRADSVSQLQSIIEFNPHAVEQARDRDFVRERAREEGGSTEVDLGTMWGLPVLIKDNIVQADPEINSTAGSFSLVGSLSRRSATLVKKLEEAGAVILGRTNMDVFANCGGDPALRNSTSFIDLSWGWSPRGGQTLSPFNEWGNVCGSSGGAGVAAFLSLAPLNFGTQTGWSIECPSHRNGIVGLRPTSGLTSRAGIFPLGPLRDTPGPMVKSVREAAIALSVISGPDPLDAATSQQPSQLPSYLYGLDEYSLVGKRIGVLREGFLNSSATSEVAFEALAATIKTLRDAGAEIVDPFPYNFTAWTEWTENEGAEAGKVIWERTEREATDDFLSSLLYSPHARNVESLRDFIVSNLQESPMGHEACGQLFTTLSNVSLSTPVNETYFPLVYSAMERFSPEKVMDELNITAVTGLFHPARGLKGGGKVAAMTAAFNLPGLTLPAGWWGEGENVGRRSEEEYVYPLENMPFGVSFVARRWDEHTLLKVGRAYEIAVGGPQVWREEGWKRIRKGVEVASGWD
ncbi:amidase signature domain-containing protein [Mrakia frigida]|uniref:amidase signature domain-containing protein n=1 Tax=Mrakia frigida TaxID=29902 RepID=UPI003FCBF7CB